MASGQSWIVLKHALKVQAVVEAAEHDPRDPNPPLPPVVENDGRIWSLDGWALRDEEVPEWEE